MESSPSNPYQAPEADLSTEVQSEPNQSGLFSLSGRIGRLRYLAYLMCSYLLVLIALSVVGIISAVLVPAMGEDAGSVLAIAAMAIVYIPLLFYAFVFAVRRLNDMGWSGWVSLLMLVPIVGIVIALIVLFKKGDAGVNQYGAQPRPNSTGVKVAAFFGLVVPFIATIGILAAIAIPAYSDYVERAKAAQVQPYNN